MALTKAHPRMIDAPIVNVKDFGAVGDGTTDDTTAFRNALEAAENGVLFIPKTANYYLISDGLAVYPHTDIEGNGATVLFKAQQNRDYITGFQMASNTSINDLNGYISTNGYTVTYQGAFVEIGIFYGVNNSIRGDLYSSYVPDISSDSSPVGKWDAPENVTVSNLTSDISSNDTTHSYGNSFIRMCNFVENIDIKNIKATGFATWTNNATSMVTSGNGVLNANNYYDVVRFEWGNLVSPRSDASGRNIRVENIYGKGLRLHDHSAVVSMGNAHSFYVGNVFGETTGQVFHCSSSSTATNLDPSVLRDNATNRVAENITGIDLYTWLNGDGVHYNAGVKIDGYYDASAAIKPINSLIVRNVNIVGINDATKTPAYPEYGVMIGDSTWTGTDVRHVRLENVAVSKFGSGIFLNNCKNIDIDRAICSYNENHGISIASTSPYLAQSIRVTNGYFKQNNLGGATTYSSNAGVGANVFRGDNVIFRDCIFGDMEVSAGSETQLNGAFLRNGEVGYVKFDSCVFANYEDATNSFDINTNAATIQPIVRDCRGKLKTDYTPKVANQQPELISRVVASVRFTAAPSTVTRVQSANVSSGTYNGAGNYTINFGTDMPDTNYYVLLSSSGSSTAEFYPVCDVSANATGSFRVYVTDASGALTDASEEITAVVMYVNTPEQLNYDTF